MRQHVHGSHYIQLKDWYLENDLIIEDINNNVGIGDWYEEVEGIFYKPLSIPPDLPDELFW